MTSSPHLWAIVLATDGLAGLRDSVELLAPLTSEERVVTVVSRAALPEAERQLAGLSSLRLIEASPQGSLPTLLLPLATILERDEQARVIVASATHGVERAQRFCELALEFAAALEMAPIIRLGVRATFESRSPWWLLPGRDITRCVRSLAGIVADPSPHLTSELLRKGALVDTPLMVADGYTLWHVCDRHQPALCQSIRTSLKSGNSAPRLAMEAPDFVRDILSRQLGIAVADVSECGVRPGRVRRALTQRLSPALSVLDQGGRAGSVV